MEWQTLASPAGDAGALPKLTHTPPLASPSRATAEQASTGSSPPLPDSPTASWLNSTDLKYWSLVLQHDRIKLTGYDSILLGPNKGYKDRATRSLTFRLVQQNTKFLSSLFNLQTCCVLNTGLLFDVVCIVKVLYCSVNMSRPASVGHVTGL